MSEKEYMTAEGLARLQARLSDLEIQLRDLRMYKGEEAIHAGDAWHDNPIFYQAEAQERILMRAIAETAARIRNAELINVVSMPRQVTLGSEVQLRFSDGAVETYRILGEADSNPTLGILSYKSPLGQALLNRHPGERVVFRVNDAVEEVVILAVQTA